jgi:hypothetical protein
LCIVDEQTAQFISVPTLVEQSQLVGVDGGDAFSTSKTSTAAMFDVTAYPFFQTALAAVPKAHRVGPVTVDEHRYRADDLRALSSDWRSAVLQTDPRRQGIDTWRV